MSSLLPSIVLVVDAGAVILGYRHEQCHALIVAIVRWWDAAVATVSVATIAVVAVVTAAVGDAVVVVATAVAPTARRYLYRRYDPSKNCIFLLLSAGPPRAVPTGGCALTVISVDG